jgi:polyisoprenoid-binding protein YceI
MYRLLIFCFLTLSANAFNLILEDGQIKAHTEVFGDNEINPMTKRIYSKLVMETNIRSIKGEIIIKSIDLRSDNSSRDKSMYELLKTNENPKIYFTIKRIFLFEDKYRIDGELVINGIKRDISSISSIINKNKKIVLTGSFDIKLTDFNLKPPTMFFLTVRDEINITYILNYKKER